MSKLKPSDDEKKPHGKGRMVYGWPGDMPNQQPLEVWFVNTQTVEQQRIGVPVGVQYEDGSCKPAQWTAENLIQTLQDPTKSRLFADMNRDGHSWRIEIRERKMQAGDHLRGEAARTEAERCIMAGPDTPGKRWLVNLRRRHKTIEQGMREILRNCKYAGGSFDPEHDPELQVDRPQREPGSEG